VNPEPRPEHQHNFWPACGYSLLQRSPQGWLQPTPAWLAAWLARPELALVAESCRAEIKLHEGLAADPLRPVRPQDLAALKDADARENYGHFIALRDALLQAGLIRMRPIIMTTSAMVFGMLPLALALNDGGEIQAPMGRAIIGGIITSTLLTLVVVPVIYSYLVRVKKPKVVAEGGSAATPLAMPADKD